MAIATPNIIGGYDHSFVEPLHDRYVCKICHLASRDPYLSECCGHVFCKVCLDNVKKAAAIANACPVCRDEEFVTFRNKQLDREIKSLHIYCTNKEKGCEWRSELNDINNHLNGCQFEEVKCSNECGKMIECRHLTSHIETECPHRKVNCQYCHDTGEHQFIEGQHKEECPKLPLPCPNKCEVGSVPREDMEAHRKECPLEMIQCEYHNVGCEVRMTRKDQKKHEDEKMKEHLLKAKCKLTDTESKLTEVMKRVGALEVLLYLSVNNPVTVASYKPISSAVVLNSSLKWSDKLFAMITMSKSGDQECPVILNMTKINKQMKNNDWYSESFYTHNKGYKMCLHVYAAGIGDSKGAYLSWFLYLMKGSHDDELTWPLTGKFEIKLLNQISDSEHHSMSISYNDRIPDKYKSKVTEGNIAKCGWGKPQFISTEKLQMTTQTCQYLKDDSLFFQVINLENI